MSFVSPYMHPARLINYDKINRTAQVTIAGLTDGVDTGITAMVAYPIGDDDLDTERELIKGADVWVFFEQGDTSMPVIAFYRRHGQGRAAIDVRRIRQENIEVLARASLTLSARDFIDIKAAQINIEGQVNINGSISQTGDYALTGSLIASSDVSASGVSLNSHKHGGVRSGGSSTSGPQ
jgi:hypothetical protein